MVVDISLWLHEVLLWCDLRNEKMNPHLNHAHAEAPVSFSLLTLKESVYATEIAT